MLYPILYLITVCSMLIFLIGFTIYTIFLIYSSLMGSPYVPSKQKEVEYILSQIPFKKNAIFIDVGCGDGRIVRSAVQKYKVKGIGYDINNLLIFWAKLLNKIQGINSNIEFHTFNILKIHYNNAQYIYVFLMPELIAKLQKLFDRELKKGTIIISHGFPFIGWEKKMTKKIPHTPFPTYFYRI